MRLVRYEDESGFLHQSLIREDMPLSDAHMGVPHDPPDLTRLDWQEIQKEINNLLIERNLITLKNISRGALENTIKSVIIPKLIQLYKENPGYKVSPNQISSSQNQTYLNEGTSSPVEVKEK